jgi:hypothetical protein
MNRSFRSGGRDANSAYRNEPIGADELEQESNGSDLFQATGYGRIKTSRQRIALVKEDKRSLR